MANFMFGDEKPSNVSFGTTTNRECFPTHVPHSRFGNELNPITGSPNRGPGHYQVDETTNFLGVLDKRPLSKKGYSLGARTDGRFKQHIDMITPDPARYQPDNSKPRDCGKAYRPFNSGTTRDKGTRPVLQSSAPGPGTYDVKAVARSRQVSYHQSFGGRPIDLPDVSQHSTIEPNTDKLLSTKDEKLYHRRLAYLKLHY